jgi:hypothetical protein
MATAAKRTFRTTKKLSGGPKNFRKWSDWEVGDIVIGTFKGTHTDQYDKECMILEVEDAQFANKKEAKQLIGKNLVLNAAGQLNKAMEKMEEGQIIQVTYNGTSRIEKGKYQGKDAHVIDVDLLEEDNGETQDDEESYDDEDEVDL